MDYEAHLTAALDRLHQEGRYRTFIDIERERGHFPHATWHRPDGTTQPHLDACIRYLLRWSFSGLPALSLPCGVEGGLPVGLQLAARPGGEEALLF